MLLTKFEEEELIDFKNSKNELNISYFGEPINVSTGTEIRVIRPTIGISINEQQYRQYMEQVRASYGRQADGNIPF